ISEFGKIMRKSDKSWIEIEHWQTENDESAHTTRLKKCKGYQINEGSDSDELQCTLRRQLRSKKRVLQSNWVKKEKKVGEFFLEIPLESLATREEELISIHLEESQAVRELRSLTGQIRGYEELNFYTDRSLILFGVTRQEKTLVRLEIIRGVISIKRARKVADLTGKKKETKKVIQDLVDLAQSRFLEHIWKFRCELIAEWEEKEGITKDNKRKPKEAEEKAKTDLVRKRRKGKEKQTPYSEAGSSNPQPEQSTRRAEREANKENQDPQREGNETERKKRKKKEEAKI
ncbi:6236_t:CDS:2, partial [Gigaspora rosea]